MRSLMNAIANVVVNGRQDRTNVVGKGLLRGCHLLRSSCFYEACAPKAFAIATGLKSHQPEQRLAHRAGQTVSAMCQTACWRPGQSLQRLLAFARIT